MRPMFLTLAVAVACAPAATAETSRARAARLGVDVVILRGGREARGSIVEQRDDGGLSVAVRRAWLRDREPEWAAELDAAKETEQRAALETLVERTQAWMDERADDGRLCAAVGLQLERLQRKLAGGGQPRAEETESEFVLLSIAADQVRRVYIQPPERKELALVAWQSGIDNVESMSVNRLRETFERQKIDWQNMTVSLSGRLSSSIGDSEREWAARQAIYEYSLRSRLEFQGTGNFVIRTGQDAAAPNGLELLGGLLDEGVSADLSELLQSALGDGAPTKPRKTWMETAQAVAEREGSRGFRVTRTKQDVQRQRVTVEDRFVARMPDGTWETIWLRAETLDASQPRPDREARIRADGQVSEALKLAEALGLGGGVETAVRFGAATMEAQQNAAARYVEFVDEYTMQLDGPPLKWASAQN